VLFAIARQLASRGATLPVYFVGVGESIDDLRPFDPDAFVSALLEAA
jgi:fused signal recognition particle receptor